MSAGYLSRLESGGAPPPSDAMIFGLAQALDADADELFALAGRVASDVRDAILRQPRLMGALVLAAADLTVSNMENLVRHAQKLAPPKRRR